MYNVCILFVLGTDH